MSLSILELNKKWAAESKEYRTQEVGSGVQRFVKDVFESDELFNLSQGRLSTQLKSRRNEFTEEIHTKEGRRADIVIYVDAEIVIPVEVEKYGNIKEGEEQLKRYQTDFDKQYGILTDGHEWRFYNNNIFRSFSLLDILKDPKLFISFWVSYTQPLNYYINFFEPLGQQKLFNKANDLSVGENGAIFFEDITRLIHSLEDKLNIAGYLSFIEKPLRKKKAVELTYAYVIQFILFKTLVDNEFDDYKTEFSERVEAIKDSIKAKHFKQVLSTIQGISDDISRNIYRPFAKEQAVIEDKLREILGKTRDELVEVAPWLDIFVFIKKYNFANVKNDIFGYIYENYLKDLYEDEQKGQYFTNPAVVDFMLDQVGYTKNNVKALYTKDKQSISIIDPSCGSGTFLYSATHRIVEAFSGTTEEASRTIEDIVNKNVFGLDIEEFPLYLAEMSILMRLMPYVINERYNNPIDKKIKVFWTKDSLAEFQNTALRNTFSDQSVAFQRSGGRLGQVELFSKKLDLGYKSYVRDESDIEDMKKSLENHKSVSRQKFDFVVGNPPYIGYNASAKMGILFFQMLHNNEVHLNDVYGINLHSVPNNPKKYSPKPNLYAFFIALGIALLKDGGRLCYIVPQTLLTAGDLDVLRYHLAKFTTIERIIIPDSRMFIGRGIKQESSVATSSLIIVVRRVPPAPTHQTEIIHNPDSLLPIEECLENIQSGRKVTSLAIPQIELLSNINNWNIFKQDKKFVNFYKKYVESTQDISVYYNHKVATHFFGDRFYFDKGLVFEKAKIRNDAEGDFGLIKNCNKYTPMMSDKSIDKKFIRMPHGSQGLELFNLQHKIIWSYMNPRVFQYSDQNIMLDFNWVIISSNNKSEILYLFALLNSRLNRTVLETLLKLPNEKSFSLGVKTIKEFIRIPLVTPSNEANKQEVIRLAQELVKSDEKKLSDFVEFGNMTQQKFDYVSVKNDQLILGRGNNEITKNITGSTQTVSEVINSVNHDTEIELFELKNFPAINLEQQHLLKDRIDQLVYKLYNLTPEEIAIVEGSSK